VGKRRSRGLLLKEGIGREGKREGRGREEREKKKRGAACPNNKKSFLRPWPVSIYLAARLKCYIRHGPIMGFDTRQTQSSRKFQSQDQKLSVSRPGGEGQRHPPWFFLSRPR